jgi:hypothetical protein
MCSTLGWSNIRVAASGVSRWAASTFRSSIPVSESMPISRSGRCRSIGPERCSTRATCRATNSARAARRSSGVVSPVVPIDAGPGSGASAVPRANPLTGNAASVGCAAAQRSASRRTTAE